MLEKVADREMTEEEKKEISEIVGVSALKYSILKSSLGSDIVYDFEKSISFDGDSGPYLQYTAVRANSILKKGQEMGLKVEDGLNFIKEKVEPAKEKRNIVEQYSPDLHQFIQEQIQKGVSPIQAGAIAQAGIKGKNFESAIKKLVKDHKTDWSSILQTVYGSGTENVRNQPQNGTSPQQTQQQTQQPKQSSSGQQALMDVLNKINQRLGK